MSDETTILSLSIQCEELQREVVALEAEIERITEGRPGFRGWHQGAAIFEAQGWLNAQAIQELGFVPAAELVEANRLCEQAIERAEALAYKLDEQHDVILQLTANAMNFHNRCKHLERLLESRQRETYEAVSRARRDWAAQASPEIRAQWEIQVLNEVAEAWDKQKLSPAGAFLLRQEARARLKAAEEARNER